MTAFKYVFGIACLLGLAGVAVLIPLSRCFAKEGKRVGFDFYTAQSGVMLLRPKTLPAPLIPIGSKIRLYSILLLWPACVLFCVAWLITG